MRTKQSLARLDEFARAVSEVFSETIHFHRNIDAHCERMNSIIWNSPQFKSLPYWAQSYVRGVDRVHFNMLYAGKYAPLTWVLTGPDGQRFGVGNDLWLRESAEYKSNLTGAHVWRDKWESGEYFVF